MKNKIFSIVGILWGGAIVVRWLSSDTGIETSNAYQQGHNAGIIFGGLMLLVGLYYFFKK